MSLVICRRCKKPVPEHLARREINLLASTGKGGTLSDIASPRPTGAWECRRCTRGLTLFDDDPVDAIAQSPAPSRMAEIKAMLERKESA